MGRSKYPITIQPTLDFLKRLDAEKDSTYTVTNLVFLQWSKDHYTIRYQLVMGHITTEVGIIGRHRSVEAAEQRVLNALKPDGIL